MITWRVIVYILPISVSALMLPMKKPNGDPDMDSVITHLTVMEKTVADLQTQVKTNTDELMITKGKLQTSENDLVASKNETAALKTELKQATSELTSATSKLKASEADLQASKDEIMAVKAELRFAEADITRLHQELQNRTNTVDFATVKTDLATLKATSNNLMKQINLTVIDAISADGKTNTKGILSLTSELSATNLIVNKTSHNLLATQAEIANLTQVQKMTTNSKITQDVAFHVTLMNSNFHGSTKLTFDAVNHNSGNDYNPTSGVFTAPVSGTYIFWASVVFKSPVGRHYVYINADNAKLLATGVGTVTMLDDPGQALALTVTYLSAGTHVYYTVDTTTSYIDGNGLSSYGGALLHAQ